MKRDLQKWRDWQKRSKPLRSRKRVKARNDERRAKAYERNYGERADAIREMRCLCDRPGVIRAPEQDCAGRIVAAHTVARGMGGVKGDRTKQVPLCWRHSEEAGEHGTSRRRAFERRYGLRLDDEAARIDRQLSSEGYP